MFGIDLSAASGLMMLAATVVQPNPCKVPKPPQISITPITKEIQYDFNVSNRDLTKVKTDTVNPYGANVDTVTNGLRHDRPELEIEASLGHMVIGGRIACSWYDTVKVTITLQPKIYIAREIPPGVCRNEILAHELRHVKVDREVVNRYSQQIGTVIRAVVNKTQARGPFPVEELPKHQEVLMRQLSNAIKAYQPLMSADMKKHQGQVDSLQEYERVGEICRKAEGR